MRFVVCALAALVLSTTRVLAAEPATCDEARLATLGEVTEALSQKAVEVVRLSRFDRESPQLKHLIDPTAEFSLGTGDVGRPLGSYLAGARALAAAMTADRYRFSLWSGIPTPAMHPCGRQQVEVEFIDSTTSLSYPVTFTFDRGVLVQAKGWTRWFTEGSLRPGER